MKSVNIFTRESFLLGILGLLLLTSSGCGSVRRTANFNSYFDPKPDIKVEVGEIIDETGDSYNVGIPDLFKDALANILDRNKMLFEGVSRSGHLIATSKVIEYKPGNAFMRWLLPGWGTTVFSVHCELRDNSNGIMVGSVDVRRTISFGGGYTIGAWKTIFSSVAQDVVRELRKEIKSKTQLSRFPNKLSTDLTARSSGDGLSYPGI